MSRLSSGFATLAVLVALLVLLPGNVLASPLPANISSDSALSPDASSTCAVTCVSVGFQPVNPDGSDATLANWTGFSIPPDFWGSTITPRAHIIPGEASLLQSTLTRVIVWPGANAGEYYNPITEQIYTQERGVVKGVTRVLAHIWSNVAENGTTEPEFIKFCESINCTPSCWARWRISPM